MESTKDYQIKQVQVAHAKQLLTIFNDLERWKIYYRDYSRVDLKLKFREYDILFDGLGSLINTADYNVPVISEKYLYSLLRSFAMLENRYLYSIGEKNYEFLIMIRFSKQKLELIGEQIFDDFQSVV